MAYGADRADRSNPLVRRDRRESFGKSSRSETPRPGADRRPLEEPEGRSERTGFMGVLSKMVNIATHPEDLMMNVGSIITDKQKQKQVLAAGAAKEGELVGNKILDGEYDPQIKKETDRGVQIVKTLQEEFPTVTAEQVNDKNFELSRQTSTRTRNRFHSMVDDIQESSKKVVDTADEKALLSQMNGLLFRVLPDQQAKKKDNIQKTVKELFAVASKDKTTTERNEFGNAAKQLSQKATWDRTQFDRLLIPNPDRKMDALVDEVERLRGCFRNIPQEARVNPRAGTLLRNEDIDSGSTESVIGTTDHNMRLYHREAERLASVLIGKDVDPTTGQYEKSKFETSSNSRATTGRDDGASHEHTLQLAGQYSAGVTQRIEDIDPSTRT